MRTLTTLALAMAFAITAVAQTDDVAFEPIEDLGRS